MLKSVFLISGAFLTAIWGIAHLVATNGVIKNFGEISDDNRNILRMEWMTEGFSLIFTGLIVFSVTLAGEYGNLISGLVFTISSGFLIAMALLSYFTGFRVNFLPYKLCPFIFLLSAGLILAGAIL
jgi:hypothetical protein